MKIKNLNTETVMMGARDFDFSEGEGYTQWEIAVERTEEEIENEEYMPLMSYIYSLPFSFEEDMIKQFGDKWRRDIKERLRGMTVVYILNENRYYLALTGGGMDLSWEICESYIELGYLPPVAFCNLPSLAGKDYGSRKNRRIIRACFRSCEIAKMRIEDKLNILEGFSI